MSVQYQILDGILRFVFRGGTPAKEIYAEVHRAYEDPTCPREADLLVDLRSSTSLASRSVDVINTLSQFIVKHPDRPGQRIAILLTAEEVPRFASMAEAFTEETGIPIQIFEEEEPAYTWLGQRVEEAGEG